MEPLTTYQSFQAFDLSLEVASKLCEALGIETPRTVTRIKRGEVNAVFLLTFRKREDLIFKVGVRSLKKDRLVREEAVVHYLQEHGEVHVPEMFTVNQVPEVLAFPYAVVSYVGGVDGEVLWKTLSGEQRRYVIQNCGEMLARVHRVDVLNKKIKAIGDAPEPSVWAQDETKGFGEAVKTLSDQGWIKRDVLRMSEKLWSRYETCLSLPLEMGLVHYDFQLHNLRIDPKTLNIVAVLDWDNVTLGPCITDARDLELNVFLADLELHDVFWEAYGLELGDGEWMCLQLHMLRRILQLFADYGGQAPNGVGVEGVERWVKTIMG